MKQEIPAMPEGRDTRKPDIAESAGLNRALLCELEKVRAELATLNGYQLFHLNRLALRALLMQFLKGTAFGLGSLVGATIVLSALAYFLSQMEVIPIVGDWIHKLILQINLP